jgi:tRNA(Ile)-lysidine synthase
MPSRDQIERFRRDLAGLEGVPERIGLAVSGGADSLALLLLAHGACPGRVEAASVDHRLRAANAEEAAAVAAVCAALGVPHAILSDPAADIAGASIQAQARALRYRLLAAWADARGLAVLATAHHSDDQAETVLMRLARGAGLGGLAGIRADRSEGAIRIVRPLIGWRRAELAAIVEEAGIAPADDPSNRCDAYDRTRYRALLAGTDLLPPERLAASASHLAEAEEALAWAADRLWHERVRQEGGALLLDPEGLPPELVRRLAARAIDALRRGATWRRDGLAAALAGAAEGRKVAVAGLLIVPAEGMLRFEAAPPRTIAAR